MEAARIDAAKHKMAQEAQDGCTKIVVLAERHIGQELIEAQKRGEIAGPADGHKFRSDLYPHGEGDRRPSLDEIGISHKQAYGCRQMADLDDVDVDVEEVAAEAGERGKPARPISSARLRQSGSQSARMTTDALHHPTSRNCGVKWRRNTA